MARENLQYYMEQNYPVEVQKIPLHLGGGYLASIPYLGKATFCADGETVEEALEALNETKEMIFQYLIDQGKPIPSAPEIDGGEKEYSGKLILRMAPELHRIVAHMAEEEGISLNQYIQMVLSLHAGHHSMKEACLEETRKAIAGMIKSFTSQAQGHAPYAIEEPVTVDAPKRNRDKVRQLNYLPEGWEVIPNAGY